MTRASPSCSPAGLALAETQGLARIAFPAISCGIYGYPLEAAAAVAVHELRQARPAGSSLEEVLLVAFADDMARVYRNALA